MWKILPLIVTLATPQICKFEGTTSDPDLCQNTDSPSTLTATHKCIRKTIRKGRSCARAPTSVCMRDVSRSKQLCRKLMYKMDTVDKFKLDCSLASTMTLYMCGLREKYNRADGKKAHEKCYSL